MRTSLIGLAAILLLASPAWAQTPPSSPPGNSPSAGSPPPPPPPPGDGMGPRHGPGGPHGGHGAFIKLRGPGGAEIAVRCADGETTRECVDVVGQLVDKVRSMRQERSGGSGWHEEDGDRRGGRWDRDDRNRDRF